MKTKNGKNHNIAKKAGGIGLFKNPNTWKRLCLAVSFGCMALLIGLPGTGNAIYYTTTPATLNTGGTYLGVNCNKTTGDMTLTIDGSSSAITINGQGSGIGNGVEIDTGGDISLTITGDVTINNYSGGQSEGILISHITTATQEVHSADIVIGSGTTINLNSLGLTYGSGIIVGESFTPATVNSDSTSSANIDFNGTITSTCPWASTGIYARSFNNTLITLGADSSISTKGLGSPGVTVQQSSTGNSQVQLNGGSIQTSGGFLSYGVYISQASTLASLEQGNAIFSITNGSITTNGSHGVYIENEGNSSASSGGSILITQGNGTITASGTGSDGIYAQLSGGAGQISITQTGGSISGAGYGIYASSLSSGTTVINTSGSVAGASAGIYSTSTGGYDIDISGGSVSSSAPANGIIHIMDAAGGTVDIASGATIDAGSGTSTVLCDGDADNDGIDEIGGAMAVTSAGTVTGTALLGLGNDSFTLAGGSWTGDIYAQEGDDAFIWNDGELNSGFYGGDGSDTAKVSASDYDGHQILDGGDDIDTADTWIDVLTFGTITADIVGANVINWETINIDDSAVISLADSDLEAGTVNVLATGTLALASSAATATLTCDLINSGTITLDTGSSSVGNILTVTGDYSGTGTLTLDADFATSTADTLVVRGQVSSTGGTIYVVDATGTQGSSKETITLICATSDSNKSDETFTLALANQYNGQSNRGRFTNSPYIWDLKASGNNWVLGYAYDIPSAITRETEEKTQVAADKTPAVISEIPAQAFLPNATREIAMSQLDTLHQRLGELRRHTAWISGEPVSRQAGKGLVPPIEYDEKKLNGWIKGTYNNFDFDADAGFEAKGEFSILRAGFDCKREKDQDTIFAGFYGSYINGDYDNSGKGVDYITLYSSQTDLEGWSFGLYGTWMQPNGFYIDLVVDYMGLDADIEAVDAVHTSGTTLSGSIEAGRSLAVHPQLIIEPQVQIKIAHAQWDDLWDGYNTVSFSQQTFVTGRAGVRMEYTTTANHYKNADKKPDNEFKPWLYLGIENEFSSSPMIHNVIDFNAPEYNLAFNVQAGFTFKLYSRAQFYGDIGYTTDFQVYDAIRADAGIRIPF